MKKRLFRFLFVIILTGILLFVALILLINYGAFGSLPNKADLQNYKNKSAALILADGGELIGKIFAENRTNIVYNQVPEHVINALVATEDARFFRHEGIDSRSVLRVVFKTLLLSNRESGGGSTISQQLAKNMYGRQKHGWLTMPITKIREALIARQLEKIYTKDEILVLYLNTVAFGENIYGIEAAARRYFNKTAMQLNIQETAVLIGMLKGNTLYNPHRNPENALARRNVVLAQMEKYKYLKPGEAEELSKLPLVIDYANPESEGPAAYFIVRVKAEVKKILKDLSRPDGGVWNLEEDGLIVKTTMNLRLQKQVLQAYKEHLGVMQKRLRSQYNNPDGLRSLKAINDSLDLADVVLHAGLMAMDPSTGAIKAWAGGINYQTNPYDQIMARRQLASAFKPILYTTAIETGISPCHYLDNKPIEIPGFDDWSPGNYDNSTGGWYSLSGALAKSMNIPTVNLYREVGFSSLSDIWEKMGFSFDIDDNPSLALGTAEASVYELTIAYASLANGGYKIDPKSIISISTAEGKTIYENTFSPPADRIISENTSILMSAMLQKAVREGTGATMASVYGVTSAWAGKTGTSQNYSDAWFGAFNPGLVIVTRVGAAVPAIHFNQGSNGAGSTLALPLVAMTLNRLESNPVEAADFIKPFTPLPEDLIGALDCPDFRQGDLLDKMRSIFDKKVKVDTEVKKLAEPKPAAEAPKAVEKRRSIFDIFKRKK
jgi:penicillin-binding protein 1A